MSYDPCHVCGKVAIKTNSKGQWECYRCAMGTVDPIKLAGQRIGRNAPCPCGSEKKFKKCCLAKVEAVK